MTRTGQGRWEGMREATGLVMFFFMIWYWLHESAPFENSWCVRLIISTIFCRYMVLQYKTGQHAL